MRMLARSPAVVGVAARRASGLRNGAPASPACVRAAARTRPAEVEMPPRAPSSGDAGVQPASSRSTDNLVAALPSTSESSAKRVTTGVDWQARRNRLLKRQAKAREQLTYKFAAVASTLAIGSIAVVCTALRFYWHMKDGGDFPWVEFCSTLLLIGGGAVGMEFWARWAHKALWHDNELGWSLHKSHHEPRIGPFEKNDIFAIINAVPAIALILYGFVTPTEVGGLCYGAGLGITLFGISYMFIHDGLVHKRFPVGPLEQVPYLRRIAVAHKLHHSEKYQGVPWGLFLGPQELELAGARAELDALVQQLGTGDIKTFNVDRKVPVQ